MGYQAPRWRIEVGDAGQRLRALAAESVHCIVTSPPYYGLRDYQHPGQIGLEGTLDAYVAALVATLREARRVLRRDGTLWLNLGDSYAGKDLLLVPATVALALRKDGWWLRQEIIWHKRTPMPESVRDRCTRAHEQLFMLTRSPQYYYDAAAICEPVTSDRAPSRKAKASGAGHLALRGNNGRPYDGTGTTRNRRSVWTLSSQPYPGAHFATFPPRLVEPCILAGCPVGGTVLDPFSGAGTTGVVALRHDRSYVGIELNPEYAELSRRRIIDDAPLFNAAAEELDQSSSTHDRRMR